ncbi:MAG: hypothetical protein R2711_17225 [Acidimicrobiales bacterium]
MDPFTLEDLPTGQTGELWLRGYCSAVGSPRERSEAFTADGWYRTGRRRPLRREGHFITGRMGDLIKSSGMNITPREVEIAPRAARGDARVLVTWSTTPPGARTGGRRWRPEPPRCRRGVLG